MSRAGESSDAARGSDAIVVGSAVSENTTVIMVPGINSLVDVSDEAADQSSGRAVPEFDQVGREVMG